MLVRGRERHGYKILTLDERAAIPYLATYEVEITGKMMLRRS
jgi:hypothetical protein